MHEEIRLTQREWIWIGIFLALLFSLVCIAFISDHQVDQEIENYLNSNSSKQTF